jgi:CDP-2,3-bis-(O-geranylgeranyl)-sn-glycerol synthase
MLELKLLVLVMIANGTPILARRLLRDRWAWPVDGNRLFVDRRPLLGPAKTFRGLLAALAASALAAPLLGFDAILGLVVGSTAMAGDLVSSFVKRRLGLRSSQQALGLDQGLESLFPMVACKRLLGFGWDTVIIVVVAFAVVGVLLSRLLFRLGILGRP